MHMETLWNGPAALGECPVWHPDLQRLYWLDCKKGHVYQYHCESKKVDLWRMPHGIGCVAPVKGSGLIGFMGGAIILINTDDGGYTVLQQLFSVDSGLRPNDGKCDRQGRFWAGTVSKTFEHPTGSLYCFDGSGKAKVMVDKLFISNGLGWSPDDRYMYHSDSWLGRIYRYPFDAPTGEIGPSELWFDYPGLGVADGLTVDADGYLWTGVWDGSKLLKIDPSGKVCAEVLMPVQRPTSCIFGQSDYRTLYVTSCSCDVAEETPLPAPNGSVYALEGLAQGLAEGMYAAAPPAAGDVPSD